MRPMPLTFANHSFMWSLESRFALQCKHERGSSRLPKMDFDNRPLDTSLTDQGWWLCEDCVQAGIAAAKLKGLLILLRDPVCLDSKSEERRQSWRMSFDDSHLRTSWCDWIPILDGVKMNFLSIHCLMQRKTTRTPKTYLKCKHWLENIISGWTLRWRNDMTYHRYKWREHGGCSNHRGKIWHKSSQR